MARFVHHVSAEQPLNKQILQMERHIYDQDVIGCCMNETCVWDEGGYCRIFYSEEDIKGANKAGLKLLDAKQVIKAFRDQKETAKEYWAARKNLILAVNSGDKIADTYDVYARCLRRVFAHFITSTEHVTYHIEQKLRSLLEEKGMGDAFSVLTTSATADPLYVEKKAWLKTMQAPTESSLLKHYRKYSVVLANVYSDEEVVRIARRRLEECDSRRLKKELAQADRHRQEVKSTQRVLLARAKSPGISHLANVLQNLGHLRFMLKWCWNGESYHLLPLFEHVSELTGHSIKDIYLFYTWRDISDLLHTGKKMGNSELSNRKKAVFLHYCKGRIFIYTGEKSREVKKNVLDPSLPDAATNLCRGFGAFPGRIRGRARLVRVDNPHELSQIAKTLEPGDILVTGMTNPTMIPLISKVSAIVTDEGGVACHAAIISREMKLPCVVGTKIATHIFQEGDMIEVDASKGTVTKK